MIPALCYTVHSLLQTPRGIHVQHHLLLQLAC